MKNQSHFQIRRDTAANWAAANPVLKSGEPGFVTDTGELKMGNGIAAFNDLPALGAGAGEGGTAPAEGQRVEYVNINMTVEDEDTFDITSTSKTVNELAELISNGTFIVGRLYAPDMNGEDNPMFVTLTQTFNIESNKGIVFTGLFGVDVIVIQGAFSEEEGEKWRIEITTLQEEEETTNNYSQYQIQSYRIPYVEGEEANHYAISSDLTYEDICNMSNHNKNVLIPQGPPLKAIFESSRIGITDATILNKISLTTTSTDYPVLCIFTEAFNTINGAIDSGVISPGDAATNITCYITKETFPAITEFTSEDPT